MGLRKIPKIEIHPKQIIYFSRTKFNKADPDAMTKNRGKFVASLQSVKKDSSRGTTSFYDLMRMQQGPQLGQHLVDYAFGSDAT